MRSGVIPLTAWGATLVAVALLGTLAFGLEALPTAELAGAGVGSILVGLAALGGERRRPRNADRRELLLENSVATTTLAVGVVVALVGAAAAGPAVFGLGAGLMLLGAGGVFRELRAGRRLLRDAGEQQG